MFYIIYETKNLINNKLYHGCHKTNNLDDGYLGSGKLIKRAIEKYGKENFQREILCFCNNLEDMIEKEKLFINEEWVNRKDTYNLQTGGLNYGILCEESKLLISISVKKAIEEGRLYIEREYGPLTEEHKTKI
jgi:hypothetical protein